MGRRPGGRSNGPFMGARVRWFRKANKWTVTKLAEEAGLTKSYVSKLERGLAGASFESAKQLANALGVHVEQVWDFRKPPDGAVPPKLSRH